MDKAVGRTSAKETYTDETGESPLHGAAFDKDLHQTPKVLWLSVALMCLGAAPSKATRSGRPRELKAMTTGGEP